MFFLYLFISICRGRPCYTLKVSSRVSGDLNLQGVQAFQMARVFLAPPWEADSSSSEAKEPLASSGGAPGDGFPVRPEQFWLIQPSWNHDIP